ncbi:MAG TPA: aspartate/glutamate racemase family protein [Nitrospirae bacterium]|nr:aspartate/glutamate racemase family protein [Nitrospirota bacterium]
MKTLGLIGGMSWESTVIYYQHMNRMVRSQLGGLHSARLLLWSFDFQEIEKDQASGDWEAASGKMCDAAKRLKAAGADAIVICTNTMHKMADQVEAASGLPLIHIADTTAKAIKRKGLSKVGLLATRYTMEEDFYKGRLIEKHGLEVVIPNEENRAIVHDIIYNELCQGIIKNSSKENYKIVIQSLINQGAEGIVLGCTEIGLLIKQQDVAAPVFDTTLIHAQEAIAFSLG